MVEGLQGKTSWIHEKNKTKPSTNLEHSPQPKKSLNGAKPQSLRTHVLQKTIFWRLWVVLKCLQSQCKKKVVSRNEIWAAHKSAWQLLWIITGLKQLCPAAQWVRRMEDDKETGGGEVEQRLEGQCQSGLFWKAVGVRDAVGHDQCLINKCKVTATYNLEPYSLF